jgi:hypothetical protein
MEQAEFVYVSSAVAMSMHAPAKHLHSAGAKDLLRWMANEIANTVFSEAVSAGPC